VKSSQFAILVLVAAMTGITWVIAPDLVLRQGMMIAVFLGMLAFGLGTQAVYARVRRPGKDAELVGNWRVPGGVWIVVGIVVLVFCLLAFVVTRDPLGR
jgi:hypothetical protein